MSQYALHPVRRSASAANTATHFLDASRFALIFVLVSLAHTAADAQEDQSAVGMDGIRRLLSERQSGDVRYRVRSKYLFSDDTLVSTGRLIFSASVMDSTAVVIYTGDRTWLGADSHGIFVGDRNGMSATMFDRSLSNLIQMGHPNLLMPISTGGAAIRGRLDLAGASAVIAKALYRGDSIVKVAIDAPYESPMPEVSRYRLDLYLSSDLQAVLGYRERVMGLSESSECQLVEVDIESWSELTEPVTVTLARMLNGIEVLAPPPEYSDEPTIGVAVGDTVRGDLADIIRRYGSPTSTAYVVDFWFASCFPCRMLVPVLERIHQDWRRRGVEVIGINPIDSASRASAHFERLGGTYTNVATDRSVVQQIGVSAFPLTLIIRDGVVRHVRGGWAEGTEAALREAIAQEVDQ